MVRERATMKPIIGIVPDIEMSTGRLVINPDYYRTIYRAGGHPIVLPFLDQQHALDTLENIDGLLLSGGDDVDPQLMGEEPHPNCGPILPIRDEIELLGASYCLEHKKPILGICRGLQVMALVLQCTIIQDINAEWNHPIKHKQQAPRWYPTHHVRMNKDSQLYKIYGMEDLQVNSFHHQAVRRGNEDFIIAAKSEDGIIEAMEHRHHPFFIGVQWHPENMVMSSAEEGYAQYTYEQLRLFSAFVDHSLA